MNICTRPPKTEEKENSEKLYEIFLKSVYFKYNIIKIALQDGSHRFYSDCIEVLVLIRKYRRKTATLNNSYLSKIEDGLCLPQPRCQQHSFTGGSNSFTMVL